MLSRRIISLFSIAILLCSACWSEPQTSGQIVTRTRLVTIFSGLQNQWLEAVQHKDASVLDRILSEDYQVWTPNSTAPVPRDEWQSQAFAEGLQSYRIRDMAVRSVRDDVAVESFVLEQSRLQNHHTVRENYFMVNVWTRAADGWRCTDTYSSPMTAVHPAGPNPVKPTGKN
jgi:ketosteroid isomerase-like protein